MAKNLNFEDAILGAIRVRINTKAQRIIARIEPNGEITTTIPSRWYLSDAKKLIVDNRHTFLKKRKNHAPRLYQPNQIIGQSHELVFRQRPNIDAFAKVTEEKVIITLSFEDDISSAKIQKIAHSSAIKALRRQAKFFLPKRLEQLAKFHDFSYSGLGITSGKTRWGSCNAKKKINLNLWLMSLPLHLIDYVIIHELCHTKEHNHSKKFWNLVESCEPNYKIYRAQLKKHQTS